MTNFFIANQEIITRLVLAMVLGMVIGIERYLAHKTAGMRTYSLVAMGSALFIIISEFVAHAYAGSSGLNPLHIAAAVITGMGFLGAGLMIHQDMKIVGLTSASGLWVASGIGMAVGFGLYSLSIIATILTLFIFIILWFIEKKVIDRMEGKK